MCILQQLAVIRTVSQRSQRCAAWRTTPELVPLAEALIYIIIISPLFTVYLGRRVKEGRKFHGSVKPSPALIILLDIVAGPADAGCGVASALVSPEAWLTAPR